MIRKVWPIFIFILFTCSLTAQIIPPDTNAAKDNPSQNDLAVFTNAEIQKMDSMLNIWYVKSGLDTKHSVLSKLKDDTTAYDNNDTGYIAGCFCSYRILLVLGLYRIQNMVGRIPLRIRNRYQG